MGTSAKWGQRQEELADIRAEARIAQRLAQLRHINKSDGVARLIRTKMAFGFTPKESAPLKGNARELKEPAIREYCDSDISFPSNDDN